MFINIPNCIVNSIYTCVRVCVCVRVCARVCVCVRVRAGRTHNSGHSRLKEQSFLVKSHIMNAKKLKIIWM